VAIFARVGEKDAPGIVEPTCTVGTIEIVIPIRPAEKQIYHDCRTDESSDSDDRTRSSRPALLVASDLFFLARRAQIAALSTRHTLPTMYDRPENVAAGGLISYGSNRVETFRQAGGYAGRILKGEKPADLPASKLRGLSRQRGALRDEL
jgi:hypothetical protein